MKNIEKVDHAIKNRIILCTGPSRPGKDVLISTYQNDTRIFSFKKIFLSTVNPDNKDVCLDTQQAPIQLLPDQGKQLNCANSVIATIKNAVNDPEVLDSDIILYKHETFFAKDLNLIRKALGTIVINGYDLVVQHALAYPKELFSNGDFFIKVSAARPLFKDFPLAQELRDETGHETNCETYLTAHLFSKVKLIYKVGTRYESKDDRFGFFHIISRVDPNAQRWDRRDFIGLFHDVNLED